MKRSLSISPSYVASSRINWQVTAYDALCHYCRCFRPSYIAQWDFESGKMILLTGKGTTIIVEGNPRRAFFLCESCSRNIDFLNPRSTITKIEAEKEFDSQSLYDKRMEAIMHRIGDEGRFFYSEFGRNLSGVSNFSSLIEMCNRGWVSVSEVFQIRERLYDDRKWGRKVVGPEAFQMNIECLERSHTWIVSDEMAECLIDNERKEEMPWYVKDRVLAETQVPVLALRPIVKFQI